MNQKYKKSTYIVNLPLTLRVRTTLEFVLRFCLGIAIIIAVIIIAAWSCPYIRPYYPTNWDLMKANTALCIFLSATTLLFENRFRKFNPKYITQLIIIFIAGSALFSHITDTYIHPIHDFLIIGFLTPVSGLMSIQTSLFFIAFSIIVSIHLSRFSEIIIIPTIGVILFFSYTIFLTSGYLFNASSLVGQSYEIRTSPQTLISMILLVISYFIRTLPKSMFSIIASNSKSGKIVRSLLPWAIIAPYSIILLGYKAFELSIISQNVAAALVGTFTTTTIAILIIYFGLKINSLHDKLSNQALLDPLTNCYNQRGFFELGLEVSQRYSIMNINVGIIYFDLDKLKMVNDTYGHEMGSNLIIHFVDLIKKSIREDDILGRLGGDEFGLVVKETSISLILERIESSINEFNNQKNTPYNIQYSFGIAIGKVSDANSFENLINQADKAMYQNKMKKL